MSDGRAEARRLSRRSVAVAMLCVVVGFRAEVFFALASTVGFDYEGSGQSVVYVAFVAGTSVLIYVVAVATTRYLAFREVVILLLPAFLGIAYLIDSVLGRVQPSSQGHFFLSLTLACPAAAAGMVCARTRVADRLAFALEPLMLVLTLAVGLSAAGVLTGASLYGGVGGSSYQTASYLGGLAFNCNLFYILFGRTGIRPVLTQGKVYRILSLLLLPIQVAAVLVSGGRGGFVLVAIGGVAQLLLVLGSLRASGLSRVVLLLVALLPLVFFVLPALLASENIARRVLRVFAYVGDGGLDWSGTSGRDVVYGEALRAVQAEPVFGYGLYSWGIDYYPHNIVLELALNGGFLYAGGCLLVLVGVSMRAVQLLVREGTQGVIVPLFLYPLVMLQFSGSYMATGPLWFCLAFLVCIKLGHTSGSASGIRGVGIGVGAVGAGPARIAADIRPLTRAPARNHPRHP